MEGRSESGLQHPSVNRSAAPTLTIPARPVLRFVSGQLLGADRCADTLRDDQWDRIKDQLPGCEGYVGVTARDNRLFVEAVLYRYRAGLPWRDLPDRFGAWKQVHTRFTRWAKAGVWKRIFQQLAADADNEYAMIDSTIVRAHQHSAGAQKKR